MAIEKLSVILELVSGNYKKEAREAANATGQIGNAATSVTGSLRAMVGPAAIGAAVAGLTRLALAAGENADRLFDLQAQTGLSTDALQEWEFVAKAAGAGTEVFSDAVKAVIRNLNESEGATGAAGKAYETLGVSVLGANGQLREAGSITEEVFEKLARMENITARNALAQDIFGKKWEETISVLDLGTEALGSLRKEAEGAVISEESLRNADEFRETFEKIKATLQAKLFDALGSIAPILTEVAEAAGDAIDELEPLLDALGFIADRYEDLKAKGEEMAGSNNVVEAGWGRMIGELGILNLLTGNYTGVIEGAIGVQKENVTSTDAMTGSWQRAQVAIKSSTQALEENAAALAAADDAELSMLRAEENVTQARLNLIAVTDDATASTDEKRIAQLEYNIAVATARVLTDEYKASVEALNGTRADVTVITHTQVRAAKERIEESQYQNRAVGGPVFAGRPYMVGELGPEMFVPQRSGSIVSNRMLGAVGNNTTIVVQSPMNDFRSDMQYATILASVTNLVEAG